MSLSLSPEHAVSRSRISGARKGLLSRRDEQRPCEARRLLACRGSDFDQLRTWPNAGRGAMSTCRIAKRCPSDGRSGKSESLSLWPGRTGGFTSWLTAASICFAKSCCPKMPRAYLGSAAERRHRAKQIHRAVPVDRQGLSGCVG